MRNSVVYGLEIANANLDVNKRTKMAKLTKTKGRIEKKMTHN